MTYEIRPYSRKYLQQAAELFSRVFGGQPEHWATYVTWKHEANPYFGEPMLHFALAHDRVIGARGMYGSCWHFGESSSKIIPVGTDFAIDDDHRGRWVDQRLFAAGRDTLVARGFEYVFSLSANLMTRRLRLQAGCVRAATFRSYRRGVFTSTNRATTQLARRLPPSIQRVAQGLRRVFRKRARSVPFREFDQWVPPAECKVTVSTKPRVSEMSKLVSLCRKPSLFGHVRDSRYYEWRFNDPSSEYRFLYFESTSSVEGFFVLQQKIFGGPITVVDWAAASVNVWTALLEVTVASGIERLQIISTKFSAAQREALENSGFELFVESDSPQHPAPGLLVDAIHATGNESWTLNGQNLLDQERWDMRMIYSDGY